MEGFTPLVSLKCLHCSLSPICRRSHQLITWRWAAWSPPLLTIFLLQSTAIAAFTQGSVLPFRSAPQYFDLPAIPLLSALKPAKARRCIWKSSELVRHLPLMKSRNHVAVPCSIWIALPVPHPFRLMWGGMKATHMRA